MHRSTQKLMTVAAMMAACGGLTAHAAPSDHVNRFYMITVPPAQDSAFRKGMQVWEKCLRDHRARHTTWAWSRETGDLNNQYVFEVDFGSWSAMDSKDPAGKACGPIFDSDVAPHFTRAWSWIGKDMPKLSHPGDMKEIPAFVYVLSVKVKPGHGEDFRESIGKYTAAAAKTGWSGHWSTQEVLAGGKGAADYDIVWPNRSWADIGTEPDPSTRQMMENVYGKAAAEANRKMFMESIEDSWSAIFSYDKDLSYIPAK